MFYNILCIERFKIIFWLIYLKYPDIVPLNECRSLTENEKRQIIRFHRSLAIYIWHTIAVTIQIQFNVLFSITFTCLLPYTRRVTKYIYTIQSNRKQHVIIGYNHVKAKQKSLFILTLISEGTFNFGRYFNQ